MPHQKTKIRNQRRDHQFLRGALPVPHVEQRSRTGAGTARHRAGPVVGRLEHKRALVRKKLKLVEEVLWLDRVGA